MDYRDYQKQQTTKKFTVNEVDKSSNYIKRMACTWIIGRIWMMAFHVL